MEWRVERKIRAIMDGSCSIPKTIGTFFWSCVVIIHIKHEKQNDKKNRRMVEAANNAVEREEMVLNGVGRGGVGEMEKEHSYSTAEEKSNSYNLNS